MSKSSNWESTIKPIVVLSVISLIASLLLALVNGMTAPVIAENTKRTTLAAYVGVLPSVSDATELEEVTDYTTANVTGVVKAPDGSLAIKAEESGFDGGIVTVIVGMDANGTLHWALPDKRKSYYDEEYLPQKLDRVDEAGNLYFDGGTFPWKLADDFAEDRRWGYPKWKVVLGKLAGKGR